MGKVVVFTEPKTIGFELYEDRPLKSNEVRLQTLYSGINAGTELTGYRGSNPYLHKQWDPTRKLFISAEQPTLTYPVSGCGYEEVGEVIELGSKVQDVSIGDVIFHNRVNIVGSQIFGTDPELTYRWNQLRLAQTFMRLQAHGVLNLRPIISHIIPFENAGEAFRILDQEPENALQVVLDFTKM